eukprot:CAMPEP_0168394132 /NCGR_PEP_ID=MMETSP0228-20121227/19375_1 /TAXON_ID=133427 /ORGANISM="Protoceratium reticulatum, Strain CCCM 535 (=CCMP 1889)" /LENGTH=176 /DNA_ID=CAMNT_0008407533 /DNA_START=56 /DNA_END=582 /DNA_ORIENTATION=-
MQLAARAALATASLLAAQAAVLRGGMSQEPDTSCGKGFGELVKGSQDYYATAAVALWGHPYHTMDNATFEQEFQCWFASMCTKKCGGLHSMAASRKDELTKRCMSVEADWLKIWNLFSQEEVEWFKKTYPTNSIADETPMFYKQAMETAKEVSKKELLCLTLFTIDDECVKWPYIR